MMLHLNISVFFVHFSLLYHRYATIGKQKMNVLHDTICQTYPGLYAPFPLSLLGMRNAVMTLQAVPMTMSMIKL